MKKNICEVEDKDKRTKYYFTYLNCLKQNVITAIMLRIIIVVEYFQVEDIKLYRDISKSNSLLSSRCYREWNAHHFKSSMPSENGQSNISFPIPYQLFTKTHLKYVLNSLIYSCNFEV